MLPLQSGRPPTAFLFCFAAFPSAGRFFFERAMWLHARRGFLFLVRQAPSSLGLTLIVSPRVCSPPSRIRPRPRRLSRGSRMLLIAISVVSPLLFHRRSRPPTFSRRRSTRFTVLARLAPIFLRELRRPRVCRRSEPKYRLMKRYRPVAARDQGLAGGVSGLPP